MDDTSVRTKSATYPEKTVVRLPAGTLDMIHEAARQQRTSAAEMMRAAILAHAMRALEKHGKQEAA